MWRLSQWKRGVVAKNNGVQTTDVVVIREIKGVQLIADAQLVKIWIQKW
jgi:hypothetical protein